MANMTSQILDAVEVSRRVFYDPAGEAYYRGSPGPSGIPSDADFIATKSLTQVEGKYLAAAEQVRRGAIFDTAHSSTIKAVIVLDRVLGVSFREFRLRELFNIIRSPELVLSADVGTPFSATGRVLPLQEAPVVNETYARTTWDLAATGKNVVHLGFSDEALKQAVHDVQQGSISRAARALKKVENTQLATIVHNATDVAGGDWGALNTNEDFSKNSPLKDIRSSVVTIQDNGFEPDHLGMHPQVLEEFLTNTFIHNTKVDQAVRQDARVLVITGFPELTIVTDASLTATIANVSSKSGDAYVLADGPTEAAQYRDEIRGMDGYAIRHWTEGKAIVAGASRDLTGVTA